MLFQFTKGPFPVHTYHYNQCLYLYIYMYVYTRLKYILIRFSLNSPERIICGTFHFALGCDQF